MLNVIRSLSTCYSMVMDRVLNLADVDPARPKLLLTTAQFRLWRMTSLKGTRGNAGRAEGEIGIVLSLHAKLVPDVSLHEFAVSFVHF